MPTLAIMPDAGRPHNKHEEVALGVDTRMERRQITSQERNGCGKDYRTCRGNRRNELYLVLKQKGRSMKDIIIKTLDGWHNSPHDSWDAYCKPGDCVDEEVYDYFLNILPPRVMRNGYFKSENPSTAGRTPKPVASPAHIQHSNRGRMRKPANASTAIWETASRAAERTRAFTSRMEA